MGGPSLHIAKYPNGTELIVTKRQLHPFLTPHLNLHCLACITCINVNISVIMFGIQLAFSAHVKESRYKTQRQINYIISAVIIVSHFIKSQLSLPLEVKERLVRPVALIRSTNSHFRKLLFFSDIRES